ncbi:hypothetical protein C5708_03100 [Caulobacter sp. CCUG 60055]|uniref:universal stress protein n=1 Tax=Caulobacter sp. CCUG 60055 TaxID=2100090 RepID=UPI001FA6F527|nr:universal stress protein [Caulobacter sp. CCUG 60055]MCI3179233.1 hypothetical protein [Caulobacter sp. CCUG 60055]
MFKEILAHVDGSEAGAERLRFCKSLAAASAARLMGLHVRPPVAVRPMGRATDLNALIAASEHEIEREAAASAALFHSLLEGSDLEHEWRERSGDVAAVLCAEAAYADLVVVGQYESQSPPHQHPLPISLSLALHSGRPTLVIPAAARPRTPFRTVLIAWEPSAQSARAVHDALPLLGEASMVRILTVSQTTHAAMAADAGVKLKAHLERHGVPNLSVMDLRFDLRDERTLAEQIGGGGFDLLVMGAYSHPMWLEFLFGGATQSLALGSRTPLLLSH